MKYVVRIRNEETGEVREWKHELTHSGNPLEDGTLFGGEENNFSCDCNRRNFFAEAGDEAETDDQSCSDGKFLVQLEDEDNGIFYDEFRWGHGEEERYATTRRARE